MPWKYKSKTLREGRGWTDDNGFKHPYNWASAWSDADKKRYSDLKKLEKRVIPGFDKSNIKKQIEELESKYGII